MLGALVFRNAEQMAQCAGQVMILSPETQSLSKNVGVIVGIDYFV
jgi:hypothetical protein